MILLFRGEASVAFAGVADPLDSAHVSAPCLGWRSPAWRIRIICSSCTGHPCWYPTTCRALPRPATGLALTERERLLTYVVCIMRRISSSRKFRLSKLAVCTLSYSGGRPWRMMSSYLTSCSVCPISSRRSKHSSKTKNKSSGSWPGSILVLTSFSWHALLVSLVRPLYSSVRAFHASCPCPAPSSGCFPMNVLTALLAEPDVMRRTLQRYCFACNHLCSATALSVEVSVLPRVDADRWALP